MQATRRDFLKTAAALAAVGGPLAMGGRQAWAAREKEMNILCWEGYNSAQVLDPFRSMKSGDGEGGIAHQRSDHDQPPARRRDQRLGPDQRQQSLGAQGHVSREADQAARPRAFRALFREDAAGLQAALQMGDERRRQGAARHVPALRPLQLRRQHRQGEPRHGGGPGLGPVERSGQRRQVRHPGIRRLERLRHLPASPASIRSASTPTPRSRSSPRRPSASSRAPSWSATSPR